MPNFFDERHAAALRAHGMASTGNIIGYGYMPTTMAAPQYTNQYAGYGGIWDDATAIAKCAVGIKVSMYKLGTDAKIDALVNQARAGGHASWVPDNCTCLDPTLSKAMAAACAAGGYKAWTNELVDIYNAATSGGGGGNTNTQPTEQPKSDMSKVLPAIGIAALAAYLLFGSKSS